MPTGVRDLESLIKFNLTHADKELVEPYWTSQSRYVSLLLTRPSPLTFHARLLRAVKKNPDSVYQDYVKCIREGGRERGIDAALKEHTLHALILPTVGQ